MARSSKSKAAEPAGADPVPSAAPPDAPPALKLKELLDLVAARSGAKKSDARPLLDAVLTELGEALSQGRPLALPPLGKARVGRKQEGDKGETLVIRLRRGGGKKDAAPPLAPEED